MQRDDHYIQAAEWKKVESGGKMPFFFHNKEKNRHEVLDLFFVVSITDPLKVSFYFNPTLKDCDSLYYGCSTLERLTL